MERYSHTQSTVAWIIVVALVEAALVASVLIAGLPPIALIGVLLATSVVVVVGLVFSRLTIEVHDEGVTARFGTGWPRRFVPFSRITSAHRVRNSPWVGWGLRWIPGGSVWNVWGLEAVEITMNGGKRWRLGTDEPEALLAALAGRVPTR